MPRSCGKALCPLLAVRRSLRATALQKCPCAVIPSFFPSVSDAPSPVGSSVCLCISLAPKPTTGSPSRRQLSVALLQGGCPSLHSCSYGHLVGTKVILCSYGRVRPRYTSPPCVAMLLSEAKASRREPTAHTAAVLTGRLAKQACEAHPKA